MEKVVARWGGIDVLVNNAGYGVDRALPRSDYMPGPAPWRSTSRRLPWPARLRAGDARPALAAASSTSLRRARAWRCRTTPPTPASKAGVDSITRARTPWRWRPTACWSTRLAPGMMDTEMQRSTEIELARVNGRNDLQAFLDERTRRIPLGRRAEIAPRSPRRWSGWRSTRRPT